MVTHKKRTQRRFVPETTVTHRQGKRKKRNVGINWLVVILVVLVIIMISWIALT